MTSTEWPCQCGVFGARLSEGLFNLAGEVAQAIAAPDLTYTMLQTIAGVSRDLIAGAITPQAAIAKAERISPGFASALSLTVSETYPI
jgi:hypothetical protein